MANNRPVRLPADRRDNSQRRRDTERAVRQAVRVGARWDDLEAWNARAQAVIRNREGRREAGARYAAAEPIGDRDDPILVVAGERLVRTDGLTREDLSRLREIGAEAVPNLEGRVLIVPAGAAGDLDERPEVRGDALAEGKPHYFAPMGPVMKTLISPEPSAGLGSAPAPSGERGLPIAVVDTGIHAGDRSDGWLAGVPESPANRDRLDDFPPDGLDSGAGHGTFATGIIQQLAPDASIRVYRALDSDGFGTEAEVASKMVQAAMDGAQIINLSFGVETDDGEAPIALDVAVDIIRHRWPDVLLVAAAGNFGHSTPCWPAALEGVTAVAALDRSMGPAVWSSRGDWVHCSTIGEAVLSPYVTGTEEEIDEGDTELDVYGENAWAIWTGTSFAAPQIAGAVAQIAQAHGLEPHDALDDLLASAAAIPEFGRAVPILPPL